MYWPHFDKPPQKFSFAKCFETGLSDFHKLTLTILKVFYAKFNHFDNASFRTDLLQELSIQNVHPWEFEKFLYISSKVLNTHAPIKEKHVTCN